jgi:hypothetical protein
MQRLSGSEPSAASPNWRSAFDFRWHPVVSDHTAADASRYRCQSQTIVPMMHNVPIW